MQTTSSAPHKYHPHPEDEQYSAFLTCVRHRFDLRSREALFCTDATGLFDAFLSQLPEGRRQHYRCRACQHFIERFGGLVNIDENEGLVTSAVWNVDDTPPFFEQSVRAMMAIIRKSAVTGVFLSGTSTLGHPLTPSIKGPWHHLHGFMPPECVYQSVLFTPEQAMAEKRHEYENVSRAVLDYLPETLNTALHLLRSEQLYRAEKVLGPVEWLGKLQDTRLRLQGRGVARSNVIWRAIADAPKAFCHPRSSMAGTLLDDIAAGLPFEDVSKKFAEKMNPIKYQRPQAAPAAGTIKQAEELFEKLGLAPALERRYAKLEEIQTLWKPQPPRRVPRRAGVFGDVKAKGEADAPPASMKTPRITMTWEKFQRTVLPMAEKLEFYTTERDDPYSAYVTAVNPEAPPLLQWDREDRRNPFSWYLWHGGSSPRQFALPVRTWVNVTGISLQPNLWADPPLTHQGEGVLFVLEGARDSRSPSACLFPETLRAELHGVRSVIEAYSKNGMIHGSTEAAACGILMQRVQLNGSLEHRFVFRVNNNQEYMLDRWD